MRTPRNSWPMRVAILVVILVAVFFVVFGARAQPSAETRPAALPDADPAMWVVRDEDTTIYLFGTFHLMDGRSAWFNDEVKAAFDSAQELVLEADIPSDPAEAAARMQPLAARLAVDGSGQTMSSRLTPEQNRKLNEAIAAIGMPPGGFERMEPWFVNMMMTAVLGRRIGLDPAAGAEVVLRTAAGNRMRFTALETLEEQLLMFKSIPEEAHLAQLRQVLDNMDAVQQLLPRMLAVWGRGDAQGLDSIMNAALSDPAMRRAMLENRNRAWAEWIARRLERPGTVFVAVGAGHLVGRDSVQTFLRGLGIPSARVPSGDSWRSYPPCRSRTEDRCAQGR